MQQEFDIKEIERRARRALFQNGILEMLFGFYLLMIGGALGMRRPAFLAGICVAVSAPVLLRAAYRRVIYPRVGYAAFGERANVAGARLLRSAALVFIVLLAAMFVVSFSLEWWSVWRVWSTRVLPVLLGALLALVPLLQAVSLGVRRAYATAAIALASGFVAPHLVARQHYAPILGAQLGFVGAVILALGIVAFIGFLRAFPPQAEEVGDVVR